VELRRIFQSVVRTVIDMVGVFTAEMTSRVDLYGGIGVVSV
jgi:hypothetical protein